MQEEINNAKLKVLFTDVWMTRNNLEQFGLYKSKIDFKTYKIDKSLKNQFIEAVMNGLAGDNPEDPYESLSEGYKVALDASFNENNSEYKVMHYLGKNQMN